MDNSIEDLQRRLSIVETALMTSAITRKDVRHVLGTGIVLAFVGIAILIGELYILNKVNKTYSLITEYGTAKSVTP